jgi:hypothetical protein
MQTGKMGNVKLMEGRNDLFIFDLMYDSMESVIMKMMIECAETFEMLTALLLL